jgi:hypothetical protein
VEKLREVISIRERPRRGLLGNSEGIRRAGAVRPRLICLALLAVS